MSRGAGSNLQIFVIIAPPSIADVINASRESFDLVSSVNVNMHWGQWTLVTFTLWFGCK